MLTYKKINAGFSLIELMVVIAIIALIAAVAVPAYQRYLDSSHLAELNYIVKANLDKWSEYDSTDQNFLTNNTSVILGGPISSATFTATGVEFNLDAYPSVENSGGGPLPTDSKALPFLFSLNTVLTYTADVSTDGVIKWTCSLSFGAGNEFYGGTLTNQEIVDAYFPDCQ